MQNEITITQKDLRRMKPTHCKKCKKPIKFLPDITRKGMWLPVEIDTEKSHFPNCKKNNKNERN
jgi:NAD-dependent SIR2 family protein deacetylase